MVFGKERRVDVGHVNSRDPWFTSVGIADFCYFLKVALTSEILDTGWSMMLTRCTAMTLGNEPRRYRGRKTVGLMLLI